MNLLGIDESWIKGGLNLKLIEETLDVIAKKRETKEILPSQNDILNAIKSTTLDNVKILIIGQDPYPSAEHAHGLAFSSLSKKTPASLRNIFKKLEQDFPNTKHNSNTLTNWAKQGILLLNTSLTFEDKDSKILKEHTKLWKPVIDNIYQVLINRKKTLVVFRWGAHAQKSGEIFENKENIYVLDTTHPSPLSANRGFMTSNHFLKCAEILKDTPIDWNS